LKKAQIQYNISIENPHTHILHVRIDVSDIKSESINLKLPVWTPGHYLIREFAGNILNESAFYKLNKLDFIKINKNTWNINIKNNNSFSFEYDVYAFDKSVRTSYVDIDHATIIPAGVFMIPEGFEKQQLKINIESYYHWDRISTSMTNYKGSSDEFIAKNYDELIDSPIELGNHKILSFYASNIYHEFAITGKGNYEQNAIINDSIKLIEKTHQIFGDDIPYKKYTFILTLTKNMYGGLEHRNSSSLMFPRLGFNQRESYTKFLGLVAHEFFHAYNVKRIMPKEFSNFDYSTEQYSKNLWIIEGITSYFDSIILVWSNLITIKEYFKILSNKINMLENQFGKNVQNLEESSFDTWIKFYRPNANSQNMQVSYYLKGSIVALLLDIAIIEKSNGKFSLKDIMKKLWNSYLKDKSTYTTEQFQNYCEKYATEKLDYIWKYIKSTTSIDYNSIFKFIGIKLNEISKSPKDTNNSCFGINIDDNTMEVISVNANGPSYNNGIYAGDEIIGINNIRLDRHNYKSILSSVKLNKKHTLTISRDGLINNVDIKAEKLSDKIFEIKKVKSVSTKQQRLYDSWVKFPTNE